jgi:hypothetical protein
MYHSTPIFWPSIRDPHPSAMKNLRAIAEFLVKGNHTSPETAVTTYYIAETLKKDYGNLSALIRNRPGFVRVENAGGPIKVYYLASIFGSTYPEQYGALRNLPDVPHTMWHSTRETAEAMHAVQSVQPTNKAVQEIISQVGAKFDYDAQASDRSDKVARVPYNLASTTVTRGQLNEQLSQVVSLAANSPDTSLRTAVGIILSIHAGTLKIAED